MPGDPWEGDKLNRRADGEHLIKVLMDQFASRQARGQGSYILNIDAAWGQGKTFFLKCLEGDLAQRGHIVASVNAWQDDHADEPLITVMAAIEEALQPYLPKSNKARTAIVSAKKALGIVAAETSKQVAFHAIKAVTGIAVEKTMERLKEAGAMAGEIQVDDKAFDKSAEHVWDKSLETLVGDRVNEHRKANDGIAEFRTQTALAIEKVCENDGKQRPMFVFVDELDRCRPLYAIKLLENLKHLFDVGGLVFVVATDSDQLAHSVKAIYGQEFEARKYLRRFFDRVFVFPDADRRLFLESIFENVGIDVDKIFFHNGGVPPIIHLRNWADGLNLSNRDIIQMIEIIETFVTSFEHKVKIEPNYLLALVTTFYRSEMKKFRALSGQGSVGADDFDGWIVSYNTNDSYGRSSGPGSAKAGSQMSNWASKSSTSLPELTRNNDYSIYTDYFNHEFQSIHGNSYQSNIPPKSVLLEYPSRVKNAGRVIDK